MLTRSSLQAAKMSPAALMPNKARHVPCMQQDYIARSIIQIFERDRLAAKGSVTAVSGDSFSGKTTILSRLAESRELKRHFRSLDLSSFFVFESFRLSISESLKLSFSVDDWPEAVTMPVALQRWILLSGVRVFAVDDVHQWSHMQVEQKSKFLSFLAQLVAPPLNMSLILCDLPGVKQAETIAMACDCKLERLAIGTWQYSEEYLRFLSTVELAALASYIPNANKLRLTEGGIPLLILQQSEGKTGAIISIVRALVKRWACEPGFHLTDDTVTQIFLRKWEL